MGGFSWRRIVVLTVLWLCAGGATATEATVAMEAEQLGPHSWYVLGQPGAASVDNQGFMSNAGFVVTPDGVVVFDALGTPALARKLVAQIRKVSDAPIRRVIVSHYHADHYYGLAVFKALGAEIWAQRGGRGVTGSDAAAHRLAQRRELLGPWLGEDFRLVDADRWLDGDADFELGGVRFRLRHVGSAHSAEDMALFVVEDGVLYSGDLVFQGRVPFVGDADSRLWLNALQRLLELAPRVLVPGHGAASLDAAEDLGLTRDYLGYLRAAMGRAVADFVPFEDAYAATDWSDYAHLPAFEAANRRNAYNTYLLMEKESLQAGQR